MSVRILLFLSNLGARNFDNSTMRLRKRNLVFSPINYLDYECRFSMRRRNLIFLLINYLDYWMSIALLYVCGCILKMSSNIRYASPFLLIDNSIMRLRKRNLVFSPINYSWIMNVDCSSLCVWIYFKNVVSKYSIRFSSFCWSIIRQCIWKGEIWYFFQLLIWIMNVDCRYILKMSSSNIRYVSPFLLIDNSIMRLRKRNLEYFRIFSPINYLDYECRLRIYLKNISFSSFCWSIIRQCV